MVTFKTSSGKEYSCPFFSTIPNMAMAFVGIDGVTFMEAAAIFSNEKEMEHLEYCGNKVDGYSRLEYVMQESYGYKACLTKPR